ncbi:MAG: hypothetical protein UV76_C0001G0056 [Candidatus Nomurabacteria bacterium GW2011_GWA2_43_15]|uniref:Lipoprotein n=2 Tax=Candidatus Nomuraibacteriota TaxID=1752729 RepID=A0A0G1DUM6_9BACT|nr:MAG: hypothetical protein UV76_C0001G0056 [Candidatus Nomurabacteria bacterium GW2011_GWA2_43_15]KKT19251.1 MAG: hypothetical protein UW02_C0013G0034 [Candidatus Nomurabacteria bacterium GW2011_GWB1_43_7]
MGKKVWISLAIAFFLFFVFFNASGFFKSNIHYSRTEGEKKLMKDGLPPPLPPLDTAAYDSKLQAIANNPPPKIVTPKFDENGNEIPAPAPKPNLWPVKTVYPNAGALLPFNRIIAYYGNLYSTKMGVLGQYPEAEMFSRLDAEVKKWKTADPSTPVVPALHYIAVVAQGSPGDDGKYRARMPYSEIDKVLAMAEKINAIVFLDIQVGFSKVETEIPLLEKYLKLPNVHLGIDPEFSMKGNIRPGKVVGTLDAADINFASNYLANLVKENNLTPKILVIHRYTQKMVTNYKLIKTLPEVQIVMHMDGWGGQAKKIGTYRNFIYPEPVQFTGFKLFYKNDVLEPGTVLMTPGDLLKLNPQPIYIQYQ